MKVGMRGQDGAQEIAEHDVDRRAIVERAGADPEELFRRGARCLGQAVGQRLRQIDGVLATAAGAVDAKQIGGAPGIDREIGIEHRGDENRAAVVRFDLGLDVVGIGRRAERAAQPAPHA